MVEPTIPPRSLDRIKRARLLNHQNLRSIPFGSSTELAELFFGNITALTAKRPSSLHGLNRFGQAQSLFPFRLQNVKSQPGRAFLANSWQSDQLAHQFCQ